MAKADPISSPMLSNSKLSKRGANIFSTKKLPLLSGRRLSQQLAVSHVPALDQWADVLTKSLSSTHAILRSKLNVKHFSV